MVDIPTLSAIVAASSVVIGVVFTILQIRHMARARRTDIIMRIYEKFESREMLEAMARLSRTKFVTLEDFSRSYGPSILIDVEQIAVYFEGIGALLEQDLVDIGLCNDLFGPSLNSAWEMLRPVIYAMRERIKEPFLFSHFEYLCDGLNAYRKGHPGSKRKA